MQTKKKRIQTSTYHVSFLVEHSLDSLVRKVSSKLHKEFNTEFVVDGKRYLPHLSLYLFSAPIINEKNIISKLEVIGKEFKKLIFKVKGLILSYDGWLMIEFKDRNKFKEYHERVIQEINPLREGFLRKKYRDISTLSNLPEKERLVLERYGDRHSMDLYNAHISLGKFGNIKEGNKAMGKYKEYFSNKTFKIISLELIRDYKDSSGSVGKSLYSYKF